MAKQCDAELSFWPEGSTIPFTVGCERRIGHRGPHRRNGARDAVLYRIEWQPRTFLTLPLDQDAALAGEGSRQQLVAQASTRVRSVPREPMLIEEIRNS